MSARGAGAFRSLSESEAVALTTTGTGRAVVDSDGRAIGLNAKDRSEYESRLDDYKNLIFCFAIALAPSMLALWIVRRAATAGLLSVIPSLVVLFIAMLFGPMPFITQVERPKLAWPFFLFANLTIPLAFASPLFRSELTRAAALYSVGAALATAALFMATGWPRKPKPSRLKNQNPADAVRDYYNLLSAGSYSEASQYLIRVRESGRPTAVDTSIKHWAGHADHSFAVRDPIKFLCSEDKNPPDQVVAIVTAVVSQTEDTWTSPTPDWDVKTGTYTEYDTREDRKVLRRFEDGWFIESDAYDPPAVEDLQGTGSIYLYKVRSRDSAIPGTMANWHQAEGTNFREMGATKVAGPFSTLEDCDGWIARNDPAHPRGKRWFN